MPLIITILILWTKPFKRLAKKKREEEKGHERDGEGRRKMQM